MIWFDQHRSFKLSTTNKEKALIGSSKYCVDWCSVDVKIEELYFVLSLALLCLDRRGGCGWWLVSGHWHTSLCPEYTISSWGWPGWIIKLNLKTLSYLETTILQYVFVCESWIPLFRMTWSDKWPWNKRRNLKKNAKLKSLSRPRCSEPKVCFNIVIK